MRRGPVRSVVAAACLAVVVGGISCKGGAAANGDGKNVLSNPEESWCPDGFEAGPSDTCFAIPEHGGKDTPVLIYLHGVYRGRGAPEEWEAVRVAAQRGFAVVLPRGKRSLCAWRAELKDHFCWPEDPEDTRSMRTVIAEWERVLWQVDALLEGGTHKRYVLGSANGGMFAAFLATRGLFPGQAFGVVNGGGLAPVTGKAKPVPMLLVTVPDDPEQGPKMKELHEALGKASWPHAFCPRAAPVPGQGAQVLTSGDVEAALRFFKREAEGTLKPQSGAYACDAPSGRK